MSGGRHDRSPLDPVDVFAERHLGPRAGEIPAMLEVLGVASVDELIERAVPRSLRHEGALDLEPPRTERALLEHLRELASGNQVWRSFIGMGYHDTVTPPAIQRHILENPGWYTAYTPYQPEISQGRLEALLNFQTLVADLTELPVANASLLDEATAAAEAMTLCRRVLGRKSPGDVVLVSDGVHPQTLAVIRTRAEPLGIAVRTGDVDRDDLDGVFAALVQYPTTDGHILDYAPFCRRAAERGALVIAAADPLALTVLRPPGAFGADVAVGSMQRFGVPLGYGGPHAAYLATRAAYARQVPGRIVGISRDACGRPALRLALQTREQHIRRGKATSNICTAQVLLAVMAQAYAVYHGPDGLVAIARRIHRFTQTLARLLAEAGHDVHEGPRFDTLRVTPAAGTRDAICARPASICATIPTATSASPSARR